MANFNKAAEILRGVGVKGSFRFYQCKENKNKVEIFNDSGLYCVVNVRSGKIVDC